MGVDHRLEANLLWPARHGKNEAGADYQVLEKDEGLLASLSAEERHGKDSKTRFYRVYKQLIIISLVSQGLLYHSE
jgi:hypothetical protein